MTAADLAAAWRTEADDLDRTAKAYKRKCVEGKAVQMILLAKQLRNCASQLEALEPENGEATANAAGTDDSAAPIKTQPATDGPVGEEQPIPEAHEWGSPPEAQLQDQTA